MLVHRIKEQQSTEIDLKRLFSKKKPVKKMTDKKYPMLRPCHIDYGKYINRDNDVAPKKNHNESAMLVIKFQIKTGAPQYRFCTVNLCELYSSAIFSLVKKLHNIDDIFDLDASYGIDVETLFFNQYKEFKILMKKGSKYILDYEEKNKYYLFLK